MKTLSISRVKQILAAAKKVRILVVGDVMLDQYIYGHVGRISPEAPVPVVEFEAETFMPGGAANVARNLTSLGSRADVFGVIGNDHAGKRLTHLLEEHQISCSGLIAGGGRETSIKTRIIAHQQQVVRVDRETRSELQPSESKHLIRRLRQRLARADAVIIGDYGKGTISQSLLAELQGACREHGLWLSFDPKPVHQLNLRGMSLITPNRKEAFELAGLPDNTRTNDPMQDNNLLRVSAYLMEQLSPALLLITLGDQGMILCRRGQKPFHIATVAQKVFDVSGAGDTVIASFTLAISAGASPVEAAIFSNHAAGVVVGKVGTATVSPEELEENFKRFP